MAQVIQLTIKGDETAVTAADKYVRGADADREGLLRLSEYLAALAAGTKNGSVIIKVDNGGVAASQTVTATSSAASADTLVIGGVTFTTRTTVVTPTHVALGEGTAATVAANLTSTINAYSVFTGVLSATQSTSIVTITADFPGRGSNLITLTETGDGYTLGGATLASGTGTNVADTRTYSAGR